MHLCLLFAATQSLKSAAATLRGLLLGGVLLVLAACGDSESTAASVTGTASPVADTASEAIQKVGALSPAQTGELASRAKPHTKSVTVGSMGGSLRLDDRTGAIYSIELRDGAAFLQGLAVLRGTQRGWYNENIDSTPKAIRNPGVGASLGEHLVLVTPKADAIWVDDTQNVSLANANVVLFEGANEKLTQVGSLSIDSYLGPAPLDNARQRKALIQERLAEILKNSSSISDAWTD